MESKWKIPGCVWSGYCRADRHRQNEIGWEGQSTFQKGESVDQLCQQDFAMSIILKSVSGVWHLHSSDCEQASDNEADDREAERQAWDCLQGGLWVKMLYSTHDSTAYLKYFFYINCCIFYNITYSQHFLCEDRSTASESHFSYVDFLCHMHKVDYSERNPQFFPQFFSLFGKH